MVNKFHMDPKKQFSKWLAKYGAIVWGIYVFAVLALIAYRPEAAMAVVYLTIIMTLNKAWDAYQYNANSMTEKALLAMLERVSMEVNIGGKGSGKNEESNRVTEEGGNG